MLGLCLIADPWLIYGVVSVLPPVHCGCVLCYWVRWIYQGRRTGQFTHRGDNYRVIGVLTLSALTIFVSSPLASPLHKRTQHVWQQSSRPEELGSQPVVPARSPGPSFQQLCLSDRKHTQHCLQMFVDLFTPADWVELRRLQFSSTTSTAIINLTSSLR